MATQNEAVIVTGSGGLIGGAVILRLAGEYRLFGLDRPEVTSTPPEAEAVAVDVTSDASVQDGLRVVRGRHGERIASVVHLAAYYDFSGEPSPLYEQVTVRGTERLLKGLQAFSVGQFLFSSTMLVHAPCQPGESIDEDWLIAPAWDYPRSKIDTENLIRAQRGPIPAVLLRIAGVYDDRCHSIPLAHQIQRIYERRMTSHVFPGDTFHGQSFVHLDDVVDAIARTIACREKLPPETAILIGEPETMSYDELQQALGRLLHDEPWETTQIPKAVAKAGAWVQGALPVGDEPFIKPWMIDRADDHYALDISRARELLGWEPRHSLRDTLPTMVAALKQDPVAWYRENKLEPSPDGEPEAAK